MCELSFVEAGYPNDSLWVEAVGVDRRFWVSSMVSEWKAFGTDG